MTQSDCISSAASRVIEKCGGVEKTAQIAGRAASSVYRWRWPRKNGGTGGLVPSDAADALMRAARAGLVDLSPEDFFPVEVVAPK